MCVIFAVESADKRPHEDQVWAAFETNPSGGGVAWREDGKVHWKKGLRLEEMQKLARDLPTPFMMHFRIPTCGGPTARLCHPFPISQGVELLLEGTYEGPVMMHNGHWLKWREVMFEAAYKGGLKIPKGKWSDSRAMAWMAAHMGLGVFEFIDEKVAVLDVEGDIEVWGGPWSLYQGYYVSNRHFDSKLNTDHLRYSHGGGSSSGFFHERGTTSGSDKGERVRTALHSAEAAAQTLLPDIENDPDTTLPVITVHPEADLKRLETVAKVINQRMIEKGDKRRTGESVLTSIPFHLVRAAWQRGLLSNNRMKKLEKIQSQIEYKARLVREVEEKLNKAMGAEGTSAQMIEAAEHLREIFAESSTLTAEKPILH